MTYRRKLIEVALPLDAINRESAREKSIRHGHPSTLHLWWARRPLGAARAVLWSSLVDDPSSLPEEFPTEEAQEVERQRLFRILEELVKWQNSNNEEVLEAARAEILKSTGGDLPNILDPFCGGGTIPLEAQRLGLPAYGGDLNPVAVLISKAMVEIPPRFAGLPPVNPDAQASKDLQTWERAQGLADDIRYYGQWMRDRAFERIGHLYPKVQMPPEQGGGEATVIAWIWARTVESPDPSWDGPVPLVKSWVLRKKKNKPVVWVEPVIDRENQLITYRIREGGNPPKPTIRDGGAVCVATGTRFPFSYVRSEGRSGRLGSVPLGLVADGQPRSYRDNPDVDPEQSLEIPPTWAPSTSLPEAGLGLRVQKYGLVDHRDLFGERQLCALGTFVEILDDVERVIEKAARDSGMPNERTPVRDGGRGALAYAQSVRTYLAFVIDKSADYWSSIVTWIPGLEAVRSTFPSHRLNMTWDHAEVNPFSGRTGSWDSMVGWVVKAVAALPATGSAEIKQMDASARVMSLSGVTLATDPPYYANVGYADLSDFFYVWLRKSLSAVWPDEASTMLVPKGEELVANPHRLGSAEAAKQHFEDGMVEFFANVSERHEGAFPASLFYAYKQTEESKSGRASTGWEVFLEGLVSAGLAVVATWPMRTERANRPRGIGAAALASSIVVVVRPRAPDAPLATRGELMSALRTELSRSLRLLQRESIAPVDLAQSAIGPGMSVFSGYSRVLEADGSEMSSELPSL